MAFPMTSPGVTCLGQKPLGAVCEEDLEGFIRHVAGMSSASTRNHYVQLVRAMSRLAVRKGYRNAPLVTADSNIIRRKKVNARNRRLEPGEEERLLAVAPPHLQRVMIAALETCCRQGELLKLQWRDVSLERGELHLRAENTKTATTRIIPISDRLRAVFEMAKTDPAGQEFGPMVYVFGDELGRRVKCIHTAWQTAVLKAHGHEPKWIWSTHRRNVDRPPLPRYSSRSRIAASRSRLATARSPADARAFQPAADEYLPQCHAPGSAPLDASA
jgi:hypothetical protein